MALQTQQALLATLAKCGVKDQPLAGALADRMEAAVPAMNFDDLSRHLHSLSAWLMPGSQFIPLCCGASMFFFWVLSSDMCTGTCVCAWFSHSIVGTPSSMFAVNDVR